MIPARHVILTSGPVSLLPRSGRGFDQVGGAMIEKHDQDKGERNQRRARCEHRVP